MKEAITKNRHLAIPQIQKEIYVFLTSKNKLNIVLPPFIREEAPFKTIITIKYVLPLISQVQIQAKPKQQLISHFMNLISHPEATVGQIKQFFEGLKSQQSFQRFASQIREEITFSNAFSKLISLPTIMINLINDPKVNSLTISIRIIQQSKKSLYFSILDAISERELEEQLTIINKLLILKQEAIVSEFLMKNKPEFLSQNFDMFSKQSNIIKCLYIQFLTQSDVEQTSKVKAMLITLANTSLKIAPSILSLLSMNELQHYSGQKYKTFYNLFYETKLKQQLISDLLLWWSVSKNFIITKAHAKVRCNILALIVQKMTKEELYESGYMVSITEGIKKRLTDGQSRQYALLVWKMLGNKLDMKLTESVQQAKFFPIQCEKAEKVVSIQNKIDQPKDNSFQHKTKQNPAKQSPSKKQTEKQKGSDDEIDEHEQTDIVKIQPKNIYDCILGLRNPHRKQLALKRLPGIIKRYKDDLVLMWNTLLRELLSPIKEYYTSILAELFAIRPEQFIESVVMFFMSRQNNIGERIYLIQILKLGIDQLSSIEDQKKQQQDQDQSFYFKKSKSRYFKEAEERKTLEKQDDKREQRTRRWGHTRIAYENSLKGNVDLKFLKKQSAINKFYPVANLLYFKIIDVLAINLIDNLRSHQVYIHSLLKLLAAFISNIKNHFDKYIVISDASLHCAKIVQQLLENSQRNNDRYEETGGLTLMLTLQVVNKISLISDQFITDGIMSNLKQIIEGSRKLPNYGMSSVLDMIESNIYQRVYLQRKPEGL